MLTPMAKLEIVGHRARLESLLDCLHRLHVVQIVDVREELEQGASEPIPAAGRTSERWETLRPLRTRLEALLDADPRPEPAATATSFDLSMLPTLLADLDSVEPEVRRRVRALDDLRARRATLPRHTRALRRLLPLVPAMVELDRYDTAILMLEHRHAGLLDLIEEELTNEVGPRFAVIARPVDAHVTGALLIFPRSESERVDAWLGRAQVGQVRVPAEFVGMPIPQALERIDELEARLDDEIAKAEAELHDVIAAHAPLWRGALALVASVADQVDAMGLAGDTGHAFVVVGWAPQSEVARVRDAIAESVGRDVVVAELPISPEERESVPVLLSNPAPARPFEFLVKLLGLPRYDTTDPTLLMAIFLPIFFGAMLGDMGYAVIVAGIALLLHRRLAARSPVMGDLARIVLLGAAWGFVFGALFGEVFGDLGTRLGLQPIWMDRQKAITGLLLFAVGIGFAHVLLGLGTGVWVSWRQRNRHRLLDRAGMILILVGAFMLVGLMAGRLPNALLTPGIVVLVVGVAAVLGSAGWMGAITGPLEIVGTFGNVLSYLRIAAIGLASVYLGRMANELAGVAGPLWLGVMVAILFHALNMTLGVFSPTIQALRLHYVEFFGKFHEVGGREFTPFGASPSGAAPTT